MPSHSIDGRHGPVACRLAGRPTGRRPHIALLSLPAVTEPTLRICDCVVPSSNDRSPMIGPRASGRAEEVLSHAIGP